MIYKIEDTEKVEKIFGDWQEGVIWGCLQKVMGEIYANDMDKPTSAVAILGDFCYVAGKPDKETISAIQQISKKDSIIIVPENEKWGYLIEEVYANRADKTIRFAMKKERNVFDAEKLERVVESLPDMYEMKMFDENLFCQCFKEEWSRDFVAQYDSYEMFSNLGMGVAVLHRGKLVAAASSYSSFNGGIEIEIATREEYRRNGLAYISGAKIILECLKRGLYPSWDARIMWSVKLAEKLGYSFDHEYIAYNVAFERLKMNDSEIKIRKACIDDAKELLEIYRPYVENTAITFEYETPSVQEFSERIEKTLKKYPYIVAEKNNEIIGYAYAGPFKDRAAYDWAVETTIYVKTNSKKKGVGKKLYNALENALKTQNITNLNACIAYPKREDEYLTKSSVEFHRHLGYRMVGTFNECGYKFSRWYDMVWMEKIIGEHKEKQPAVKKFGEIWNEK